MTARGWLASLAGQCSPGLCLASLLLSGCHYDDWALPGGLPAGGTESSTPPQTPQGGSGSVAPAPLPSAGEGGESDQDPDAGAPSAGSAMGGSSASAGSGGSIAGGGMSGSSAGAGGSIAGGGTGGSSAAGTGGAGPTQGCDLNAPFGHPVALGFGKSSSSRDRTDGRLSADEKTIYYHAYYGIWVATRSKPDGDFETDGDLLEQSNLILLHPNLSTDGKQLFYALNDFSPPSQTAVVPGMYVADADPVNGGFKAGIRLNAFSVGDGSLFMPANGRHAYFIRDFQLWVAERVGADFAPPTELTSLYEPGKFRLMPVVNKDETVIYFGSGEGSDNYDIYQAVWDADKAEFENPVPVPELNGPTAELPNWLSLDGCRLYLHRYDMGWNSPQLMVASKPPLVH